MKLIILKSVRHEPAGSITKAIPPSSKYEHGGKLRVKVGDEVVYSVKLDRSPSGKEELVNATVSRIVNHDYEPHVILSYPKGARIIHAVEDYDSPKWQPGNGIAAREGRERKKILVVVKKSCQRDPLIIDKSIMAPDPIIARISESAETINSLPKCPRCGSKDTGLIAPDFETYKCKSCNRNFTMKRIKESGKKALSFLQKAVHVPIFSDRGMISKTVDHDQLKNARISANRNPTKAQKLAGNYRKGHVKIHGLYISIETPKGAVRSGVDQTGKAWKVRLKHDYGYIRTA